MNFYIKTLLSALIIAGVSELGKRTTWVAAILVSLPLISILSLLWIYLETKDVGRIITLSQEIFWAVLPSLLFFVALPFLLKRGLSFYMALGGSVVVMVLGYWGYYWVLRRLGLGA